jgi:putative flippase GtrA
VRFARYVFVGAANTAASYGVYLLSLLVVDYRVAYTVAYAAGLAGGYWAQARWVFRAPLGAASVLAYLFTYAVMYLVSLFVLYVAVDWWSLPKPAAMLAALAVTIPASFLLLRRGFRRRA